MQFLKISFLLFLLGGAFAVMEEVDGALPTEMADAQIPLGAPSVTNPLSGVSSVGRDLNTEPMSERDVQPSLIEAPTGSSSGENVAASASDSGSSEDTTAPDTLTPLFRFFSGKYGDHLYTTDRNEVSESGGWVFEGITAYIHSKEVSGMKPLYRTFQVSKLDHIYSTEKPTTSEDVRDEGIQGYISGSQGAGLVPLNQYYSEKLGDHFYTTDSGNSIKIGENEYKFGKIEGYVVPPKEDEKAKSKDGVVTVTGTTTAAGSNSTAGTGSGMNLVPLFRYWNPRLRDHYYTINFDLLGNGKHGWRYQGIQAYIYKSEVQDSVPLYKYWNIRLGDHFYTTKWNELGTGKAGYQYKGILGYVLNDRKPGAVPMYRYYNAKIGDHFFTDNWSHLGTGKNGWSYEGISCYVFPDPSGSDSHGAGTTGQGAQTIENLPLLVPLYRYWNVHFRDHFYTTLWKEVEVGTHGWQYQGVQALVFATQSEGTVPLYRYWNIQTLDHFYTTNFNVLEHGGKNGWVYEGIQCYVSPYRRPDTVPLYRYFNQRIADHFYTTKWIGKNPNGWRFEGIQAYVHPRPTGKDGKSPSDTSGSGDGKSEFASGGDDIAKVVPLYRYWNDEIKDHFYTTNWDTLKNGVRGWKYDGIQAYVYNQQKQGTVPFYRYWNPRTGDHFYTTSNKELKDSQEWKYQGITAYVYSTPDQGGIPLYRYYNARTGDHFYTTNWKELERGSNGFEYQGIADRKSVV